MENNILQTTEQYIEQSTGNSKVYDSKFGYEYNLGFKKHKGMVSRVVNKSLYEWLKNDFSRLKGNTCIVNMSGSNELLELTLLKDIINSTEGYKAQLGKCIYYPKVKIIKEGCGDTIDVIDSFLPWTDKIDDKVVSDMCSTSLLIAHASACNKVDNLVLVDYYSNLSEEDTRLVARILKNMTELYDCYLSNVIYIIADEAKFKVINEEINKKEVEV